MSDKDKDVSMKKADHNLSDAEEVEDSPVMREEFEDLYAMLRVLAEETDRKFEKFG